MTPEERLELERELAAELEALPEEEEDAELLTHQELPCEYVRLDLAVVLQDAAESIQHAQDKTNGCGVDGTTWSMLMESVAHCEAVVFAAFDLEMEELQTQLLPKMKALTSSVCLERRGEALCEAEAGQRGVDPVDVEAGAGRSEAVIESQRDPVAAPETVATQESVDGGRVSQIVSPVKADDVSLREEVAVTPPPEEAFEDPQQLVVEQEEDAEQVSHHTERESVWLKAQLHAQRAQQELEAMMATMASQWELEQSQLERQRREASVERESRAMMAREETATRVFVETQRVAGELVLMQREDALAQCVEALLERELQRQAAERQQMAQEETRTWRHLRQQRETQRKEKLLEELSRLKRWHHRVMEELVCTIAARAEAKRRAEDVERRRVQRELSAMRSEEHWMRRVVVQERALREERRRQEDRRYMEMEDAVARRIRSEERQRGEVRSEGDECVAMRREDQRSREWETLWRLRIKQLRKWDAGKPQRLVREFWTHWRRVVSEELERELGEKHEQRRREAALTIRRCLVRYVEWRRAVRTREACEAHTEATQAAKVVQSAFRGFHVRRKFQNALEMAKTMDFDGENEFGEVNLDDLIQVPPELEEDWETPTMAAFQRQRRMEPAESSEEEEACESEEEEEEEEEEEDHAEEGGWDEETARERGSVRESIPQGRVATPKQSQQTAQPAEGGGSLAAQLWNRMRSKTLKRQHVQEEKKRQQDPEYRAKKVLGKASSGATTNSNNHQQQQLAHTTTVSTTVSWATNTDKKKAPKVKLPSLVERLRKKTAATR